MRGPESQRNLRGARRRGSRMLRNTIVDEEWIPLDVEKCK